jgi:hypothetical protein
VDGRNDESQGDLASVAAIPDTERKRPSVPADGFSLMEKWKSPLHPLSEGAWRFSYQKNWGTSNANSKISTRKPSPTLSRSCRQIALTIEMRAVGKRV